MKFLTKNALCLVLLFMTTAHSFSQQVSDTTYRPEIPSPVYPPGKGPVVLIDEGHQNFHTREGRYLPFARLLERDGYVVQSHQGEFTKRTLSKGKILVISNALHPSDTSEWALPTISAFTRTEIVIVADWVRGGGSLFLIADHMPMGGAAQELASQFGFGFTDGFALDTVNPGPGFFKTGDGTLNESILTKGRDGSEAVGQVASFTGQGFRIPKNAIPVLTFSSHFINLLPDTAWVFNETTRIHSLEGWNQGAFSKFGEGRVVVFGEAAMFTAQLAGPDQVRAGMNSDIAGENYRLLLNIIHWLDGKLD